ncbi:MAG: CPBP family intramembrane metalloprotease [Saprospiraceae bacterium]|nr:CPBP family intramembrane metalloprotease [Saprospiraceae bacterium]
MRNKTVFSVLVPLVFLAVYVTTRQLPQPHSYTELVVTREVLPLLLTGLVIWWLHGNQWRAVPAAWGLSANGLEALKMAFIFCLPMLIGYAFLADFQLSLSWEGFLLGCLGAAVSEELFYRGFVFGQLFRFAGWGFLAAGLLNALVFGSGHLYQAGDLGSAIGVFSITALGGLWFAWLYVEWDNNLYMPMAMHFFMNLWWNAFEAGPNAAGGLAANIFRAATVAISIIWTIRMKRKRGQALSITRNRWF